MWNARTFVAACAFVWLAPPSTILADDVDAVEAAITPAQLQRALARYRNEPRVWELVREATRATKLQPERAQQLAARARTSGLVPTVRLTARRGQQSDLSEWLEHEDGRTNFSTDDELMFQATLTFDLDRIVYADDEPALLREERAWRSARLEVLRAVVRAYFERKRLLLEQDLLEVRSIGHAMRIVELEALLDVFTGGAFTRMMAQSRNRVRVHER